MSSRPHYLAQFFFALLAAVLIGRSTAGAAQPDVYVPEQLRPWVEWVQEGLPLLECALVGSKQTCDWPGELALDVASNRAEFRYHVRLDRRSEVTLPGSAAVWPLGVEVRSRGASKPLVVLERGGRPAVRLETGVHELRGEFLWEEIPESVLVPSTAALVELRVLGNHITAPKLSPSGELWLRSTARQEETEEDSLHVEVQRYLADSIPFGINTRLELRISGKARDIDLGDVLLGSAHPHTVHSALPYRLDSDNHLIIQAKPGVHEVLIESVLPEPPLALAPPANPDVAGWPDSEIWVWQADETLRSVELSGPAAIDPARTSLPPHWKGRPTFIVRPDEQLTMKETRRGEQGLPPNAINLNRTFWLDIDGAGFTIRDALAGTMYQGWRLDAQPEMQLGNVKVDGNDQLITANRTSKLSGVELRTQNFSLTAASRIGQPVRTISAVGWDHDVNSLQIQLNLPPGWSLFEASGVDSLSSSWLDNWTLLDMFFVLLVAAAAGKLLGYLWGVVALCAMVLGFDQVGAPMQIWVHLLVCVALLRLLPEGWVRKVVQAYFAVVYVFLVIVLVAFVLDQVRSGLFPQLEYFGRTPSFDPLSFLAALLESGLGGLLMIAAVIAAVVLLFMRRWRYMFLALGLAAAVFVARAATSVFFSYDTVSREVMNLPADAPAPQKMMPYEEQAYITSEDEAPALRAPMSKSTFGSGAAYSGIYESRKKELTQVDPRAVVQTGPGLPSWSWRTWNLRWNGPVKKDHALSLYLIGPGLHLLMSLLRVVLFIALAGAFLDRKVFKAYLPNAAAAAVAALLIVGSNATSARADDFPSPTLLKELEQRLLEDRCRSNCASAANIDFSLSERGLKLVAQVHSRGAAGWPIPGPVEQFFPLRVLLDNEQAVAIRREADGFLWVRVPDGVHSVAVDGLILPRNVLTLQFALSPQHVSVSAPDWSVDGLSKTGSVGSSIQFTRKAVASAGTTGDAEAPVVNEKLLAHWFIVRRELRIGLPWTVDTTVTRLGSVERPAHAKVKLLAGESVTTGGVRVEDGSAIVSFPRGSQTTSWSSNLEQDPLVKLSAPEGLPLSEVWSVECSPIWSCEFSGIKPTTTVEGGKYTVSYLPWPGDQIEVEIYKPKGIPGSAVTIDSAELAYVPGVRLLRGTLTLSVRSSQGGWRKVLLPDGAEVAEVRVNGEVKAIRPQGRELALPLQPGAQQFAVSWQQPWTSRVADRMPDVRLGSDASNVKVNVSVPEKRWVVWTSGPSWGPVVLIWGKLVVVLIFALLLGRSGFAPLKTRDWVLLGLGLVTLPAAALVIPFFWLVALSYRRHRPFARRWPFNFAQLGLIALTIAALLVLYLALRNGLISRPDMHIRGNGSSNTMLRWYVDIVDGAMPRPLIISFPIWLWRAVMLAWSTWLVFALLRWLRWGWECFSSGSLWKVKGKPDSQQS